MNFLEPWAFFLSILAIAPILLLYLVRQRPRPRTVSTLLFWAELVPQSQSRALWRRLRHWLSYLLQVLFLLLLLLALARPFFHWQAREATDYLVLLDASPSMAAAEAGESSAWEQAIAEADRRIGQLRGIDRMAILRLGSSPEIAHPFSSNPRSLRHSLQKVALSEAPAEIEDGLEFARQLANSSERSRMLLLTDLVWPKEPHTPQVGNVEIRSFHRPLANVGLTRFDARRSLSVSGEYTLTAEAVYEGPDPVWRGELTLYRDDQLIDARAVEIESGGRWRYLWQRTGLDEAHYRLELAPGSATALRGDKSAAVVVPALPPVPVQLTGERDPFLEAALEAIPMVELRRTNADPERGETTTAPPALLILNRTTPPTPDVPDLPLLLIQPAGNGFWGTANGAIEQPAVVDFQRDHPLLRHVDLQTVEIRQANRVTQPELAEVFAESFDAPLFFGRWEEDERWLVLTFSLAQSDLAFRTAFPILLSNIIQSLDPADEIQSANLPGEIQSRLLAQSLPERTGAEPAARSGNFGWFSRLLGFPPWWWALLFGLAWLLLEWRLYTRRVTE